MIDFVFYRERGLWSSLVDRFMGKDMPHSGHFDIVRPDGSQETVNSSNQNCLYHAVIQATTNDPHHVIQQKASELRSKVSQEVSNNYTIFITYQLLLIIIIHLKTISSK